MAKKEVHMCPFHQRKVYAERKDALLDVTHITDKVEFCLAENGWHLIPKEAIKPVKSIDEGGLRI